MIFLKKEDNNEAIIYFYVSYSVYLSDPAIKKDLIFLKFHPDGFKILQVRV